MAKVYTEVDAAYDEADKRNKSLGAAHRVAGNAWHVQKTVEGDYKLVFGLYPIHQIVGDSTTS